MGQVKVDFEKLTELVKETYYCIDNLSAEERKMKDCMDELSESFKDSSYKQYENAMEEIVNNIDKIKTVLNDLREATARYAIAMSQDV